jgi:hypothetical protein
MSLRAPAAAAANGEAPKAAARAPKGEDAVPPNAPEFGRDAASAEANGEELPISTTMPALRQLQQQQSWSCSGIKTGHLRAFARFLNSQKPIDLWISTLSLKQCSVSILRTTNREEWERSSNLSTLSRIYKSIP